VATAESDRPARTRLTDAILWGGLAAGVLDALAAIIDLGLRGVTPDRMFQGIASGLLGRAAFTGGWPIAALGVGIHFSIAFTMATVFVLASTRLPFLLRRPVLSGIAFGAAAHFAMRYGVLPLSAITLGPFSLTAMIKAVLIHMVCVGLPIALIARRVLRPS
jgi:hypothetical protein